MVRLQSVIAAAAVWVFTVYTACAVGAGEGGGATTGGLVNFDAYRADLTAAAARTTRSVNPARISSELTGGHVQQLDPLMNNSGRADRRRPGRLVPAGGTRQGEPGDRNVEFMFRLPRAS